MQSMPDKQCQSKEAREKNSFSGSLRGMDLAVVDVETSGGTAAFDRIIEVAVLRIRGGDVIDSFATLVNPERPVSGFIEDLTGIRNWDLRRAPAFADIKDELFRYFQDAVFVAHNAGFDYDFLKEEFERQGLTLSVARICTMRLSRTLYPQFRKHSLDALIERFEFSCPDRHRALGDALILRQFLRVVMDRFPEEKIMKAIRKVTKGIEHLPCSTG